MMRGELDPPPPNPRGYEALLGSGVRKGRESLRFTTTIMLVIASMLVRDNAFLSGRDFKSLKM